MIFSLAGQKKKYETEDSVKDHLSFLESNINEINEIDLRDNVFLPVALTPIFNKIKKCRKIRKVILSRVFSALPKEIFTQCLEIIIESLDPTTIYHFDISQNALSCDFPEIFSIFISRLENVRTFKIDNCGLGALGGERIAKALRKIKSKKNLMSIDISTNKLTTGASHIGESLNLFYNIEEVFIQYNNIDRETMSSFLSMIGDHNLIKLDIRDNFIDAKGCKLLGEYFITWDLEELRLSDCLIKDEGLKAFVEEANSKRNQYCQGDFFSIQDDMILDLSFNDLSDESIKYLVEFIKHNKVKELRLEGNEFEKTKELLDVVDKKDIKLVIEEEDENENENQDEKNEDLVKLFSKL